MYIFLNNPQVLDKEFWGSREVVMIGKDIFAIGGKVQ
jgi:hypothetical protein